MRLRDFAVLMVITSSGWDSATACKSTDGALVGFGDVSELEDAYEFSGDSSADALVRGCAPEQACTQPYNPSPHFLRMVPGPTESPNPVFLGGGCHVVFKSPTYTGVGLRRYKLFMSGAFGGVDGVFRTTATNASNGTDWGQPFTASNLVLPGVTAWVQGIKCPDVHSDPDERLVMYFKGFSPTQLGVGRAQSSDQGLSWTIHPASGPVLVSDQTWEISPPYLGSLPYVDSPSVLRHTAKRKDPQGNIQTYTHIMAYQGCALRFEGKIGIAYSSDGITWVKREESHPLGAQFGNPVVEPGICISGRVPFDSKSAARPRLVADPCDPATIHLFYTGLPIRNSQTVPSTCSRIGLAYSTDYGITWSKYANNPVFEVSTNAADWDHGSIDHYAPSFVTSDDLKKLRMYYIGNNNPSGGFEISLGVADAAWANFPRNIGAHCPIDPHHPIDPQGTTRTRVEGDVDLQLAVTPTPALSDAMVSFTMPSAGLVSVRVFDAGGRRVAEPFSGHLSEGRHEIALRRGDLASGIYTVTVSSDSWRQSIKLTWIR